jgi:hypothetical protein
MAGIWLLPLEQSPGAEKRLENRPWRLCLHVRQSGILVLHATAIIPVQNPLQ